VPLQFLKALLPDPASLGPLTKGKTCIGCQCAVSRTANRRTIYIYNICDHEECYREVVAGHLLHHRRARDGRRQDDAHRQVARRGGLQHGAVRPPRSSAIFMLQFFVQPAQGGALAGDILAAPAVGAELVAPQADGLDHVLQTLIVQPW
jgi:hypothetical protein